MRILGEDKDPTAQLELQREAFDVPAGIAYFNTASLSPQLRAVRFAGETALLRRARPWTIAASDWFNDVEHLRALFGTLVGGDVEGVALVPATSYGLAVAARNLPLTAGGRIVVLAEEYPSGIYTWRAAARRTGAEVQTVTREPGQTWTEAVLAALDEQVAVVSVPNVHWTDGALVDLATVAERVHELGAKLVIDASQSLGVMPLDVAALRPAFVVAVGYKWLLGPFGLGYLWVSEECRDGQPLEENWIARSGSEDFARLVDYRDEYQPGARRFDVGQRTGFELTPMAIAALEQLLQWRVERIAVALSTVTRTMAERAIALGFEPLPAGERGPHILGLRLSEEIRSTVLTTLAGANCFAGVRAASLRLSPHLHTTDADVDQLFSALATCPRPGRTR